MKPLAIGILLAILGGPAFGQATVTLKPLRIDYGIRGLHTQEETVRTSIEFVNQRAVDLQIHSIDKESRMRNNSTIRPGSSLRVETFVTCPWVVSNSNGSFTRIYMPVKEPGKVIIEPQSP